MKYCVHCGAEVNDEAVICVHCGRQIAGTKALQTGSSSDNTMQTVIKVFLILGCIAQGCFLLPLAWCLPITISICKAMKEQRPVGTGLKVCALIFVNLIAGICLLCMNDD